MPQKKLATPWDQRNSHYDIVIIGSGYGGSITAARLATAGLKPARSICILERGKEWQPGDYPEQPLDVLGQVRSDPNPLGLYELLNYTDISVIKGSGLGGTSLINANVAIRPDPDVFKLPSWPTGINYDGLTPYYKKAFDVLAANPYGNDRQKALNLPKVRALAQRAKELGIEVTPLDITVNFTIDGLNPYGVEQKPCVSCGNCVTGCNVGAKNTLYMNYLPMAKNAGAIIHTQTKVEWLEELFGGGWRIHGKHVNDDGTSDSFTLNAGEVILCAGSLNSTEILLRSKMHGLSVSPALGTRFSGNGDFFGLAYNTDFETDVLGYPYQAQPGPNDSPEPGPNIVGLVRYNGSLDEAQRISVEDFSFPLASVAASKTLFAAIPSQDTVTGNEAAQRERLLSDLNPFNPLQDRNGALDHTMLYLVMGQDDARGTILFEAPWTEPDGRIQVSWDQAGQQQVFTRMNAELRRHARALRGSFISNPTWSFFNLGHLITAHPLGGCPMGDDYLHGAVDIYGRVFGADGTVHQGLYVADGSVIPSALGVNPFLTISALTESFVDRKIRQLGGEAYPDPKPPVSMDQWDPQKVVEFNLEVIDYNEGQLEALFQRSSTLGIDTLVNTGAAPLPDWKTKTIRSDAYWKGFFPKGSVLNAMSSTIFVGFKKQFQLEKGKYTGVTSDTDNRINARNSLEVINVAHNAKGTLDPGQYILLRYLDPPWQGFYDVFTIIDKDLLIGRAYLGEYPDGVRLFTFPMVRTYPIADMTVSDHKALYDKGTVPSLDELNGVWRMDVISNANPAAGIAYLEFTKQPDGKLQANYQLMGVMEGLVIPSFALDHFQLNDFSQFHDEIRQVSDGLMLGKYIAPLPAPLSSILGNSSLGVIQTEADGQFGFYYMLTPAGQKLPTNTLLRPFLDVRLPEGVGMTFDERMEGWYFPGLSTPSGPAGDLTIPTSGDQHGAVACDFTAHMIVSDVNEFVDGYEHEAQMTGPFHCAEFEKPGNTTIQMDAANSRFNYLRINPATGKTEMNYHLEFLTSDGRRFLFDGTKYLSGASGPDAYATLLRDYTTLYCHVQERMPDGGLRDAGRAYMKFRTFENLQAVTDFASFLASFQFTGTDDNNVQFQARMRFLAFTAQFVERQYDPLSAGKGA